MRLDGKCYAKCPDGMQYSDLEPSKCVMKGVPAPFDIPIVEVCPYGYTFDRKTRECTANNPSMPPKADKKPCGRGYVEETSTGLCFSLCPAGSKIVASSYKSARCEPDSTDIGAGVFPK